jgi:hypothetical protein
MLGTISSNLEDTIQDLEDALSREGFDLDPIEFLRETLLPEFVETKIERKEVDKRNEGILSASRKALKKIRIFVNN